MKKLTFELILKRIKLKNPEIVGMEESSFKGMRHFATFIDKDFGIFERYPEHMMLKGSSHPKRIELRKSENSRLTLEEIKLRLKKAHGNTVTIDPNSYNNASKKAIFIDKYYGAWESLPSIVIRGHKHPNRAENEKRVSIKEIEQRIAKIHGDTVKIDRNTYSQINAPAIFFDIEYGKWETQVKSVLRGRGHPQRGYLLAAKKMDNSFIKKHWSTNEEIVCQASWEAKVVDYLNNKKINFLWQPKTFLTNILTPKGNYSTYRPDFFLVDEDKWVEIKGRMYETAEKKWEWFLAKYPHAELWDRSKLKELGIL